MNTTTVRSIRAAIAVIITTAFTANAAAVSSTGSGDWETAGTWSPSGVPGAGDDVTISVGHTITINGLAVNTIQSLVINGTLKHADNSTTEAHKIILTIGGNLTVDTSGTIDVKGRGYDGSQGPGEPLVGSYTGGSHGGQGGTYQSSEQWGPTYGSATAPTNFGSGGSGNSGGGAIQLTVGGATTIDGTIDADGAAAGYPSGAGGSVFITTGTMNGSGTISADGGTTTHATVGSGGGGRVAVVLTSGSSFGSVSMSAGSDHKGSTGRASSGTIFTKTASQTYGTLSVDGGGVSEWYSIYYENRVTAIPAGETVQVDSIAVTNGAQLWVPVGSTLTVASGFTPSDVSGTLIVEGTLNLPGDFTVSNLTFQPLAGCTLGVSNLTISSSAVVNHRKNQATELYTAEIDIPGDFTLEAGGTIDLDGVGYRYGRHPSDPMITSDYGLGGSHGGEGGRSRSNEHQPPKVTYGSAVAPTNIGAGGRRYGGANPPEGGGAIRIQAGGTVDIDGTVSAGGIAGSLNLNGGGAGGSVWIIATDLTGSGTIRANGGEGTYISNTSSSGGGGGRIAVELSGSETFGSVTLEAFGGAGRNQDGAAGTIYLEKASQASSGGHLIVDNNDLPNEVKVKEGDLTENIDPKTDLNGLDSVSFTFSKITVTNAGDLSIGPDDSITLTAGGTIAGDPNDDEEGVRIDGGSLILTDTTFSLGNAFLAIDASGSFFSPGTAFNLNSGASFIVNAAHSMTGDLTVASGATLTHDNNRRYEFFKIDLTAVGNITIDAGGSVDVTGMGYRQDAHPDGLYPGGDLYGMGGSHGGRGGNEGCSYGSADSWRTYGSIQSPTNIGAGGFGYTSPYETDGGGAIKLNATGTMTVNGEIIADGLDDNGNLNGGGAGGSVFLTASSLAGSGTIRAQGGDSTLSCNSSGGGGGRIAVHLTGSDSFGGVSLSAFGGVGGQQTGAAGTVYKQGQSQAANRGTLIVDNNGQSTPRATEISAIVTDAEVGDIFVASLSRFGIADNQDFTFYNVWSNAFVFESGTNATVNIEGTGTSEVYGDQIFSILSITNGGKTVKFNPGDTNSVLEGLTLTGEDGNNLLLRSIVDGQQTYFNVDGAVTPTLERLDVKDNNANLGAGLSALNSTDSGNNDNWFFVVAGLTNTWIGTADTSWANNANWNLGRAPIPADALIVISNGTFDPLLPSSQTLQNLGIYAGATLGLNGMSLTVSGDTTAAGNITASSGLEMLTFSGDLTFSGTLTLVGTEKLFFAGDVDFTGGTIVQATSHVFIDGGTAQHMTSGGQSFYRLTVTNQSAEVTFIDAAQTIYYRSESANVTYSNNFTATDFRVFSYGGAVTQTFKDGATYTITELFLFGSPGKVQTLQSTASAAWNLNVPGAAYVNYVDASYSDASGGINIVAANSTDSGNNVNWDFGGSWKVWTGDGGSSFHTAGSWSPSGVPADTDRILVDDTDTCTLSSPAQVYYALIGGQYATTMEINSELQVASNVVVMKNGTLEVNNDPGMTVSNNLIVSANGTITHNNNTTTEADTMVITVRGDLNLLTSGSIGVNGKGYREEYHPAGPMVNFYGQGGSHGGLGGKSRPAENRHPLVTYDSVIAPTNIGAGGFGYTSPRETDGGGAIKLIVDGTTTVEGSIQADGLVGDLNLNGGGAGGSVWLTTANLAGSGTIRANGGEGTYSASSSGGGGGRVAVILTSGTSFGSVAIQAYGGNGLCQDGGAGTVYLQKSTETSSTGHLIVDNNDHDTTDYVAVNILPDRRFYATTDLNGMQSVSYAFGTLTLTNAGILSVGLDDTLNITGTTVAADGSDDEEGIVLNGGTLTVDAAFSYTDYFITIGTNASTFNPATSLTIGDGAELRVNIPHSLTCDVTVNSGGSLTHDTNYRSENNRFDLDITGDLSIASSASVNVDDKGYYRGNGPAGGGNHGMGGGYGGQGGHGNSGGQVPDDTYGSIIAPTNIGSAGQRFTVGEEPNGGGAAILAVSGTTTVNGSITANGVDTTLSYNGGGSGGSIFLTTASLSGNGLMRADGGETTYGNTGGGGGGRISVVLTGSDSFGSISMRAFGGDGGKNEGAAGTIYRETQTQGSGAGIVVVNNNGLVTDMDERTQLPAGQETSFSNELENATLVLTNSGAFVELSTSATVGELLVYTNAELYVLSRILNVHSYEHSLQDVKSVGPGHTYRVDTYAQVNWLGVPAPVLDNVSATNVTATSAYMNAFMLYTGAAPASVSVYYGASDETDNKGAWDTSVLVTAGAANGAISHYATSLTTDQTYFYRFYATNALGEDWGTPTESFLPGIVHITADATAYETGLVPGTFTVHRAAAATNGDLSVAYSIGGDATAVSDYEALNGSVTIPENETTAQILVTPISNPSTLVDVDVIVTLDSGAHVTNAQHQATVTIVNAPVPVTATNVWSGSGNASVGGSWSLGHVPNAGELVLLNATSTSDMTWDSAAPAVVGAWRQESGYTGTVSFETEYDNMASMVLLTIAEDCTISDGVWTHGDNNTDEEFRLNVSVGGDFTLSSGGSINVQAKGYEYQQGPGRPVSANYSGGSHGGIGGYVSGYPGEMGPAYGSYMMPTNLGSGGRSDGNAEGGGAVRLNVDGLCTIDGTIDADGQNGSSYAGGAGGSVYITAATFGGSGTISADGASVSGSYGAGGGGRVSVVLSSGTSFGSVSITARPATLGGNGQKQSAGTVYTKTASQTHGTLKIDNAGIPISQTGSPHYYCPGTPVLDGESWYADVLVLTNGGSLRVKTNTTLTIAGDFTGSELSGSLVVEDYGTLVVPAGDLTISSVTFIPLWYGTLSGLTNVTIASGGAMSHIKNNTDESYRLRLDIPGDLTVQSGGEIDVQGKGYEYQQGPGQPVSANYSGGSHGGIGGYVSGYPGQMGPAYGSYTAPINLGSGGRSDTYAEGGGVVRLNVGGLCTINGDIGADGDPGGSYAGGAGGSVYITAATFGGSGTISADGASASGSYGAGAGGRVSVVLSSGTSFGSVTMTAYPATLGGNGQKPSAGTVYTKTASQTHGTLKVDNNGIQIWSNGGSQHLCPGTPIPDAESWQLDVLAALNGGRLAVTNGTSLTFGGSFAGSTANGYLDIADGGTLVVPGGDLTVTGVTFMTHWDATLSGLTNLTINSGGVVSHMKNNGNSEVNKLKLNIPGDLTIDTGGRLDVSAAGYGKNYGPGKPSSGYNGGSYGGVGGRYSGQTGDGSTYGSVIAPTNAGSGAGSNGGYAADGGGVARVIVGGDTTVNGEILSDGGNRSGGYSGGSGGSIYLTTATLSGSGTIRAGGANQGGSSTGNGAGGRVAVVLTSGTSFGSVDITAIGGTSGGAVASAPGTVYLETAGDGSGRGRVIIDRDGGDNSRETHLPPETDIVANELDEVILVVTNSGSDLTLTASTTVRDLLVHESSTLTVGAYNLSVTSFEHDLGDRFDFGPGNTTRVDTYSQVLWLGTPEPLMMNAAATNVMLSSAYLNGSVIGTGMAPAQVHVYYGDNNGTTNKTGLNSWDSTALVDANAPTGSITHLASGLTQDLMYYFRYYGSNTLGDNWASPSLILLPGAVTVTKWSDGDEATESAGVFSFNRAPTATNAPLTVFYTVGGDADAGTDYVDNVTGSIEIPVNATNATLEVTPLRNWDKLYDTTVTVAIAEGPYVIGTPGDSALTIANEFLPSSGTNIWNGSGNASVAGNWSLGHTPQPDEVVLIGPLSTSDMVWDTAASNTVRGWAQLKEFAGSKVTFQTTYGATYPQFTITENVTLEAGNWTHADNSTTEANRLKVSIGGNLHVESNATISVNSRGYDNLQGPGAPTANYDGGGYGGMGGDYSRNNIGMGATYGDYLAPTNLGSGGRQGGAYGGGAIHVDVGGTITVDGTISADGGHSGGPAGSGAGGSVWITAGAIAGFGMVSANGDNSHNSYPGGGGGRISVILTNTGTTFSGFAGSIDAFGGNPSSADYDGAAGTVYQQEGNDTAGQGKLLVNNNGRDHYQTVSTAIPAGDTWNIYDLVIASNGFIGVQSGSTLDIKTTNVVSQDGDGIRVYDNGTLTVSAASLTIDSWRLVVDSPVSFAAVTTVATNGLITHSDNSSAETFKMDLTIAGSLTVAVGGAIDVDGLGYDYLQGPGPPTANYDAGGHGGLGGDYSQNGVGMGLTYGDTLAPTNFGSGGRQSGYNSGGGAIKITAAGALVNDGTISANGGASSSPAGGPSGGSVYLTVQSLTGSGTISANGEVAHSSYPGGGGGRVAVILSSGGATFSGYSGAIQALGGNSPSANYDGAAGTVYRRTGNEAEGAGMVTIDNAALAAASASRTILPPNSGGVTNDLIGISLVVTNEGHLGVIETTHYLSDIYLYGSDGQITLGTNILYVHSDEHHLDDAAQTGPGGPTNQVDNYDQIIWLGPLVTGMSDTTIIKFF